MPQSVAVLALKHIRVGATGDQRCTMSLAVRALTVQVKKTASHSTPVIWTSSAPTSAERLSTWVTFIASGSLIDIFI